MNCHAARALLDLHAEGRLVSRQARAVDAHLKVCATCARTLACLRPSKAPAVAMPSALKERLRAALKSAAADLPPLVLPRDPAAGSGLSISRDALIALVAALPLAALAGATAVEAATTLGALVAASALVLHGLRRGRWVFSAAEAAPALVAGALSLFFLARGSLGPSFDLPAALCRAACPVLFLVSAVALGGEEESASLRRVLLWTSWVLLAPAILNDAFPWEAAAPLASVALGAAAGLRALAGPPRKFWALAVPAAPAVRRGLSLALAGSLAALAFAPAVWLADDYKLSSARNLAALVDGRAAALGRLDSIWRFSPAWPSAQLEAGDLSLRDDDAAGALRRWAAVEAAAPDYAGLAYREGLAFGKLGDWTKALAYHRRARVENPLFIPNLEQLSASAKTVGDFKLAREVALTVISLEPKDPIHWLALNDIAAREKKALDRRGDRHVRGSQPKRKPSL